ncbi:MAG: 23S rRNA (pseudouridine(1915)-N(3))-methyltransferase RlmH [Bacteroidales bacterium]|nr:23S rRNA (pseudouridine(1915)-N(3))-methyltransferase RlmH [Bacteroidales bacterium]
MKLSLFFTGKTSSDYLEKGIKEYEKRINRYIDFEIKTIKDLKASKSMPLKTVKQKEGEGILKYIKENDILILLDEKGKQFTSREFAKFISHKNSTGVKHLIFLIGGAYGFSEQVYKRANEKISLSKMTFSHQPVRLLFAEQLYRAFTIIKGEPYHND